jgi:hypothetical protein
VWSPDAQAEPEREGRKRRIYWEGGGSRVVGVYRERERERERKVY